MEIKIAALKKAEGWRCMKIPVWIAVWSRSWTHSHLCWSSPWKGRVALGLWKVEKPMGSTPCDSEGSWRPCELWLVSWDMKESKEIKRDWMKHNETIGDYDSYGELLNCMRIIACERDRMSWSVSHDPLVMLVFYSIRCLSSYHSGTAWSISIRVMNCKTPKEERQRGMLRVWLLASLEFVGKWHIVKSWCWPAWEQGIESCPRWLIQPIQLSDAFS